MSLTYNRVTLAGNLTRDPEIRPAGQSQVAAFTLALNRKWKDSAGQLHEETSFVDCEAWGRTAELIAQYLGKGSPVLIEGRLKQDSWEDKASGARRSKIKVVTEELRFLPDNRRGPGPTRTNASPSRAAEAPAEPVYASQHGDEEQEPPF